MNNYLLASPVVNFNLVSLECVNWRWCLSNLIDLAVADLQVQYCINCLKNMIAVICSGDIWVSDEVISNIGLVLNFKILPIVVLQAYG